MKYGIIYCATTPSGKRYVGQTRQTLAARISGHKRKTTCRAIHAAIVKYGDEIEWRVLEYVPVRLLNATEQFYIAELSPELNLTAGGEGGSPCAETRALLSARQTGKRHTAKTRASISVGAAGKPKMSLRGKPLSAAHKAKIGASSGAARKGKKRGKYRARTV